jgi:D-cysteine desulfhydrase
LTAPIRTSSATALFARLPELATSIPTVDLGVVETPVERWNVAGVSLLAKRDDLSSEVLGGNKVRALEFLLAGVKPGDTLLTVGPTGSTHALAVARHGRRLGADTQVVTWPQELHDVARATGASLEREARVTPARSPVGAYVIAGLRRLRGGVRWIPAGGSVALGALGHVNAALELAAQLARDGEDMPEVIVAPLGSGGTVAGLLVGLSLAGARTRVVGVQVVPRLVASRRRVLGLARRTQALLEARGARGLVPLDASRLEIDRSAYGGAYGRVTPAARAAMQSLLEAGGPRLDGTYSAKAFVHALERARALDDGRVLFWLTFDGRWLDREHLYPTLAAPPP